MEANRQRRGTKAKFAMSFYRASKPSAMSYSNKVMTTPTPVASVGFVAEGGGGGFAPSAQNRKAAVPKKEGGERFGAMADQECVDNRATSYISYVQERFKMEQMEYDKMHLNLEV